MHLEVKDMNYALIRERLEEAYRRSPDAPSFLCEILVLLTEHGLLEGEWCCVLPGMERTRSAEPSIGKADLRSGLATATG